MSILSSRAAVLAALFAATQLAACGGDDNETAAAPAPVAVPAPTPPAPTPAPVTTISPLKVLAFAVTGQADGTTPAAAGSVSDPTANGATLGLGDPGSIVLTVDASSNGFIITTPGYHVFNRFGGSVLMLCDAGVTPGTTTARFVAVAQRVADGGVAPEAVISAAALSGQTFYKLSNCAYQAASGSQDQDSAADGDTLRLDFDASGNATSNAMSMTYTAAEISNMLANGASIGGIGFTAWRFTINGQPRTVLVERSDHDAVNQTPGTVQLWLPQ